VVKIPQIEEITRRLVRNSLETFLRGERSLNWIRGMIESSGVLRQEGMLQNIFDGLRGYGSLTRYQEILKECRKERWI
jgi:hypothetical protein